jgi:hypothetical protein
MTWEKYRLKRHVNQDSNHPRKEHPGEKNPSLPQIPKSGNLGEAGMGEKVFFAEQTIDI